MFTFPFTMFSEGFSNTFSTLFNGIDETVVIADDATIKITNNLSVFCWVKSTNATDTDNCIGKFRTSGNLRSWLLGLSPAGSIEVQVNATGALGARKQYFSVNTVNDGNWHYIGFTFVSNVLKLYIDGVEESVTTPQNGIVNAMFDTSVDLYLGSLDGSSREFDGNMDEVSLWDTTVLSASDILGLYNSGKPTKLSSAAVSANLVSWWRMGDGDSATTVFDNAGSNDGTLTNMDASNYVEDVPS